MKTIALLLLSLNCYGIVKYDEGRLLINGVQLLQDKDDPKAYYYLPQYPRIAQKEDKSFEFVCIKYVGKGGAENNGGILHALIEFSLPDEIIKSVETELQKRIAGAKLVGPVPLLQTLKDGEDGLANIKVVSAILSSDPNNKFMKGKIITSEAAPLLPNSRAAIAVNLSQDGATLLWDSFKSNTSDVSISVQGYYEAYVKGYNATIKADISTIYKHFVRLQNAQEGFSKSEIRKVVNDLQQNQSIQIEVFDRSEGLGINAGNMQNILDLVAEKLTTMIFDSQNGWSKAPEKEIVIEPKSRQERGWFSRTFLGSENTPYYSDNQYVLKNTEDIKSVKFYLNLSKSCSIKVPIYTSGNLGGLYSLWNKDNPNQYFKTIYLESADFQKREIGFQLDASYAESFIEIFNAVSVSFKKKYPNGENDVTEDVIIRKNDIDKGIALKNINYPRLGIKDASWLDYEYKVDWSLKGSEASLSQPSNKADWLKSTMSSVVLIPPFSKKTIEVEIDRELMKEREVLSANIRFFVILNKQPQVQKSIVLKDMDTTPLSKFSLYHDINEPIAFQIVWYSKNGNLEEPLKELKRGENYLYLTVPAKNLFKN